MIAANHAGYEGRIMPGTTTANGFQPYVPPATVIARVVIPSASTGILPMRADTSHVVTVAGKRQQCLVRDRRAFLKAKALYVCANAMCAGRTWASIEEVYASHPNAKEMADRGDAHPVGLWSEDFADPAGTKNLTAEVKRLQAVRDRKRTRADAARLAASGEKATEAQDVAEEAAFAAFAAAEKACLAAEEELAKASTIGLLTIE